MRSHSWSIGRNESTSLGPQRIRCAHRISRTISERRSLSTDSTASSNNWPFVRCCASRRHPAVLPSGIFDPVPWRRRHRPVLSRQKRVVRSGVGRSVSAGTNCQLPADPTFRRGGTACRRRCRAAAETRASAQPRRRAGGHGAVHRFHSGGIAAGGTATFDITSQVWRTQSRKASMNQPTAVPMFFRNGDGLCAG